MALSGKIHIDKTLVIHGTGPHLLIRAGKQLDNGVPILLVFLLQKTKTNAFQILHSSFQTLQPFLGEMIMGKVLNAKFLGMDFVHGRCGIGYSCHFICVILLPPIKRSRDVHGDKDLADKLSMINALPDSCHWAPVYNFLLHHNKSPPYPRNS